ncbi:hypothetical protein X975_00812, partial [Stegodyphus mimosarum]
MEIRLEKIEVRLKEFLHKLNVKSSENEQGTISVDNCSKIAPDVKLSKLNLLKFTGNVNEWITFNDLFKAAVHNNDNLSKGQNLQYLLSALKGNAFRVIKSIPVSDQNYEVAWSLLEERFSNHREQVFANIKRFMSVPSIHSESASALLNLIDITFAYTRALEILERKTDGFADTMFAYVLLHILGPSTKLQFEREFDASTKAYGAVVYVKLKVENGMLINLVASKSRVAPLKELSLPRLELMAALLVARLASELKPIIDKKTNIEKFLE